MTVWIDGNVNGEYEEDMRLSPMIEILKKSRLEKSGKGMGRKIADNRKYTRFFIWDEGRFKQRKSAVYRRKF